MKSTMSQAAELLNCNIGLIILIRSKGSKLFDPTFPTMTAGRFNQAELLVWQGKTTQVVATTSSTRKP